jgi:hypothetical protein
VHSVAREQARASLSSIVRLWGRLEQHFSGILRLRARLEQHFSNILLLRGKLERPFQVFCASGAGSKSNFEASAPRGRF